MSAKTNTMLVTQVDDCQAKLQRADKLIGGLGGEKVRWQQTVSSLGDAMINVVGDVVVAAGSIAYSGPFTPTYRYVATVLGSKCWTAVILFLKLTVSPSDTLIL